MENTIIMKLKKLERSLELMENNLDLINEVLNENEDIKVVELKGMENNFKVLQGCAEVINGICSLQSSTQNRSFSEELNPVFKTLIGEQGRVETIFKEEIGKLKYAKPKFSTWGKSY